MSNLLLAYTNRADAATLAAGSWNGTLVLNNLKNSDISLVARSANATRANTRFRADLGANYTLQALALVNHNFSTNAFWRVRAGTAPLDLDFLIETLDERLTTSGGAGRTRVDITGTIVAATCPRIDYNPTNLASGVATQTLANVPAGVYGLAVVGSGSSVVASGAYVENSGSVTALHGIQNVVRVTATGSVTLTVAGTATALHFREVKGLLIEEQRTNLIWPSSQTTHANWAAPANATATDNVGTAPDASSTLASLIENSALGLHAHDSPAFAFVIGTSYVFSRFVKAVGARDVEIGFPATVFTARFAKFNLSNGTVRSTDVGVTADIKAAGNGVYWISASATCASSGASRVATFINLQDGTRSYTGDGASGLQVWGADLQAGSFVTSHIPTTTAAVTATADSVTMTGSNFSSWYGATAGAIYVEFDAYSPSAVDGYGRVFQIDDTTNNNAIALEKNNGTSSQYFGYVAVAGVAQVTLYTNAVTANTATKVALAYQANAFALSHAGGTVQTDSSGSLPTVTRLVIGGPTAHLNGHIRRLTGWAAATTGAQTQTITGSSGPDALGYNSGFVNAKQLTFYGDTPSDWGAQYAAMVAMASAISARYLTVEIVDTANTAGYLDIGRLFVGGGFQPTVLNANASGFADSRDELSTVVTSPSGKRFGTERRRPKSVKFALSVLTEAEADRIHEMQAEVGILDEVLYVPDPADMAKSQRYGFLGYLKQLSAIEWPLPEYRSIPFEISEKL